MNTIINELIKAYLDGRLKVKPHSLTDEERAELEAVERRLSRTKEDFFILENFISEYGSMYEQRGFCAGFRTAFDLLAELGDPEGVLE